MRFARPIGFSLKRTPPSRSPERPVQADRLGDLRPEMLDSELFARTLVLERKRAERSGKRLLLMLIDGSRLPSEERLATLLEASAAVTSIVRLTDTCGWYRQHTILGAIYTDVSETLGKSMETGLRTRVLSSLREALLPAWVNKLEISFHEFPELGDRETYAANPALYPDLQQRDRARRWSHLAKRAIDVTGSLTVLLAFSPLLALIALAIKLTSKGPVLFVQQRVGQYGLPFAFLKFRSMEHASDPGVHHEYVKRFIAGEIDVSQTEGDSTAVYKIQEDSRVTRVGNFLRRTSLDELPQLVNVLKGEMSLVGPRPPIPYELASYRTWHLRRVLEAKPGITGLWQVKGRSRIRFDDMVRLDLQYARNWSLWLDVVILLKTPRALFSGGY